MKSLESSSMILSESAADVPSRATTKRPWYVWASAAVAAIVGLYFLWFFIKMGGLPQNLMSLNGIASLLPLPIALTGVAAALGLVLNQTWGKMLLLITGLLLLALGSLGGIYFFSVLSAAYSSGYAVRLLTGFLLMLVAFIPALSIWLAYFTMRRSGDRFAIVAMPISLFLLGIIILFLARLG